MAEKHFDGPASCAICRERVPDWRTHATDSGYDSQDALESMDCALRGFRILQWENRILRGALERAEFDPTLGKEI